MIECLAIVVGKIVCSIVGHDFVGGEWHQEYIDTEYPMAAGYRECNRCRGEWTLELDELSDSGATWMERVR